MTALLALAWVVQSTPPNLTILENEILLADLVARLGLKVELPEAAKEAAFFVWVKDQPAETILKRVAQAGAFELEETPSGWKLRVRIASNPPDPEPAYRAWLAAFQPLAQRTPAELETKLEALTAQVKAAEAKRANGWAEQVAKLNTDRRPYEMALANPALLVLAADPLSSQGERGLNRTRLVTIPESFAQKWSLPVGSQFVVRRTAEKVDLVFLNYSPVSEDFETHLKNGPYLPVFEPISVAKLPLKGAGSAPSGPNGTLMALAESVGKPMVVRTLREPQTTIPQDSDRALEALWDFRFKNVENWTLGLSPRLQEREIQLPLRLLQQLDSKAPYITLEEAISVASRFKNPLEWDTLSRYESPTLKRILPALPALRVVEMLNSDQREKLLRQEPLRFAELSLDARARALEAVRDHASPQKLATLAERFEGPIDWSDPAWSIHLTQLASPRQVKVQEGTEIIGDITSTGPGWKPAVIREMTFRIGVSSSQSTEFPLILIEQGT